MVVESMQLCDRSGGFSPHRPLQVGAPRAGYIGSKPTAVIWGVSEFVGTFLGPLLSGNLLFGFPFVGVAYFREPLFWIILAGLCVLDGA